MKLPIRPVIASSPRTRLNFNLSRICSLVFLCTTLLTEGFAQSTGQNKLEGIVKNTTNEPVDGASLYLKDAIYGQVIARGTSNRDGSFSLAIPAGNYVLAVTYLGSLAYQSELLKISADLNLGVLKIATNARNLKEVVIQTAANKPLLKVEGRKMSYMVEKSITAQGTNALEALKKTPGVIVNQDNTLTLNGASGALLLINGRQTYLQAEELAQLLKSMAASDLKAIEIIKNPSAEYDAAGTGGIVNLVLKKSITEGFNGSISTGLAYGETIKQNTNLSLNFRKGKVNLFGNYNHNFGHYAMDYDNDRTTNGKVYLNANHDVDKKHSIGSTLGMDYGIDTTKTIGIVATGNFSSGGGLISPTTRIFDQVTGQHLQTLKSESSYPDQLAKRYNANINYRYKGANQTTLDIDGDYGLFDAFTTNLSSNTFYSANGDFQSANNFLVTSSRDIKLYALKADYGFPIGKGKVLTGAKFSKVQANNSFEQYDLNGSENVIDINLSNTFNYQEQITAAYLKYERPLGAHINLDIGLRVENTISEGNLQPRRGSNQSATSVHRDYLDFFPTAAITYTTQTSGTYNLSFARRVDRPAYNNLNPFSYPVDELSSWKGNPFLQPQYANTLALQYSYKSTTIATSYTHTSDISGEILEVLAGNVVNMVPRNIGLQNNINLTITQQVKLTKFWELSLNGMGYHLANKVGTPEYGNYSRSRFAGMVSAQQTLKLPGQLTAEIASVFNTKRISGLNTVIKANSQIDLGLQKNLLHDKATLRVAATDLFKTNRINTDTQLTNLIRHTTYTGETRQVRLTFSYRFGNSKLKKNDSRESGLQNESQRL
jgi:hypothetical protein